MEHIYFIAFFVGILIAISVMLTGIGGGLLWTPFLIIFLKLTPDEAITTALIIQMAGMGAGTFQYMRTGRVDWKLASIYIVLSTPMVIFGSYIGEILPGYVLKIALGIVAIGVAVLFIFGDDWYGEEMLTRVERKEALKYSLVPMTTSFLSGVLSVGVGDFIVPLMVKKLKLSMEVAIGTAVMIMLVVVLIGVTSHLLFGGSAAILILLWAIPGVIIGGLIGPMISSRVDDSYLREFFIFLLLFVGIHILYTSV